MRKIEKLKGAKIKETGAERRKEGEVGAKGRDKDKRTRRKIGENKKDRKGKKLKIAKRKKTAAEKRRGRGCKEE